MNLQFPINQTSLGQCSTNILYELFTRGETPNIFPIGEVNLSSFDGLLPEDFPHWLRDCIQKAPDQFSVNDPSIRLWHLNGSWDSIGKHNFLYSFLELDNITETEANIIRNHEKVFFPCEYNLKVAKNRGLKNVDKIPLGFNYLAFKEVKVPKYANNEVVIGVVGKLEKRKGHPKLIKLLAENFGKRTDVKIHLHVFNHFLDRDPQKCAQINQHLIAQYCGGNIPPNFNIYGFFEKLSELNKAYNIMDMVIDASGGESFSLPSFSIAALGKQAVVHYNSGMKEWANEDNSFLVQPSGKIPAEDGLFFPKEGKFNIGNIYDFSEEEMVERIEKAISVAKNINESGKKLQKDFTWKRFTDKLLEL